ncbi:hypothetical protein [Ornithinimicrobium sufpigmenti]|uniref:hypothetical protein n=1 Tax=Ornithinimicrobium sufpigmenti TaxID=2508882 RepID=UPI0010360879|nr:MULTISPECIES: hypothetical protein [unclassified Ornithinimicrobium]
MTVPAQELRAWAKSDHPTEAAVELLIRAKGGRFARDTQPWIERPWPTSSLCCVDWDRLHDELGVFSGGERRFLNIAISMGSSKHPVDLSNDLTGLDDELLLLVLAATAHAAGRPRLLAPATPVPDRTNVMPLGRPSSQHHPARPRLEDEPAAGHGVQRHEGPIP